MSNIDHTYDDGEDFDATDEGGDVVPDGQSDVLLEAQLAHLAAAGFVEEGQLDEGDG